MPESASPSVAAILSPTSTTPAEANPNPWTTPKSPAERVGSWDSSWDRPAGMADPSREITESNARMAQLATEGKVGSAAWQFETDRLRDLGERQKLFLRDAANRRDRERSAEEARSAELESVFQGGDRDQTIADVKLAETVLGVDRLSERGRLGYDTALSLREQAESLRDAGRGMRAIQSREGKLPSPVEARERLQSLDASPAFRARLFGDSSTGQHPDPAAKAEREALTAIAYHTAK